MYEREIEQILYNYPEIIEEGLEPIGRQVSLFGKRADLLFMDDSGKKLIVELKRGEVTREHVGQLIEYLGSMLRNEKEDVRAMLVAGSIPSSMQVALDHFGIEWKTVSDSQLVAFLQERGEEETAQRVHAAKRREKPEAKTRGVSLRSIEPGPSIHLVDRIIDEVLKPLGRRITSKPGHRYSSLFLDGRRFAHFYDRQPSRIQIHLEKRYLDNNGLVFDKDSLAGYMKVGETKEDYPIYIFEDTDLSRLAGTLKDLYG